MSRGRSRAESAAGAPGAAGGTTFSATYYEKSLLHLAIGEWAV